MTARRYYICDTLNKVRLRGTHLTPEAALERCQKLNREYDSQHDRLMARYFCGDWCDVKTAMEMIDNRGEWPWEKQ